jgi:DNA transformation protein and related proteins
VANSPSFVQYVLDLLNPIAPVTARSMFGGHGLYSDGMIFGLLDDGELFLKTDEQTRAHFTGAGCKPWVYPSPKGPMTTSSYQPPGAAMEDSDAMRPWLELALAAASRSAAAKAAKKAKSAARRSVAKPKPVATARSKSAVKSKSAAKSRARR